jgi:hypothetical protein
MKTLFATLLAVSLSLSCFSQSFISSAQLGAASLQAGVTYEKGLPEMRLFAESRPQSGSRLAIVPKLPERISPAAVPQESPSPHTSASGGRSGRLVREATTFTGNGGPEIGVAPKHS